MDRSMMVGGRLCRSGYFAISLSLCFILLSALFLHHYVVTDHEHLTSNNKYDDGSDESSLQNAANKRNSKSDLSGNNDVVFSYADDLEEFGMPGRHRDSPGSLKERIDDLERMKTSVLNELLTLEMKRKTLREDLAELRGQYDALQADVNRQDHQLSNLYKAIEHAKLAQREIKEMQTPDVSLPAQLLPPTSDLFVMHESPISNSSYSAPDYCTLETCFDFSRCSITAGLGVYLEYCSENLKLVVHSRSTRYLISEPANACIFLSIVDITEADIIAPSQFSHWRGDGRNHLIIIVNTNTDVDISVRKTLKHFGSGRHMTASSDFVFQGSHKFRENFDFVIPPILNLTLNQGDIWKLLPPLLPVKRRYLLSFFGEYVRTGNNATDLAMDQLTSVITGMGRAKTNDICQFIWECSMKEESYVTKKANTPYPGSWKVCTREMEEMNNLLKDSTYSLILTDPGVSVIGRQMASNTIAFRLISALQTGAVPVIIGSSVLLPFHDVIDWNRAAITVPAARTSELHFILRSITDTDLVEMRRFGRSIYEQYLSTVQSVVMTTLTSFRTRIKLPASSEGLFPHMDIHPVFPEQEWSPSKAQVSEMPLLLDPEEYLGPVEFPYTSPAFLQNFSILSQHGYSGWNDQMDVFNLFPFRPFNSPPPTGMQFAEGSDVGFRPINEGQGGSGREFSQQIGGNYPREQFTIVVLTYERESVLVSSLQRFNQLPYLNKVIVIWNNPKPPSPDTVWPKLSVPLLFLRPGKNSLNNRFLPLKEIETEAVFSIDDDVHLTPAEIIFAFRVWRERRDQIVGFPGRFHAWDGKHNSWLYNSNHSCELSMVLTGAAFFHKYYAYLYTYTMPEAIRTKVDQLMNCEDLAMNFLVSHITRKPPIKVTSKWTFNCPGCPETLSADESHFVERHGCMELLTRVYGYNPLLYTQYRVDSVLFKTRLPRQHQKCFKFI